MTDQSLLELVNGVLWPSYEGVEPPEWVRRELGRGLGGVFWFGLNLPTEGLPASAAPQAEIIHSLGDDALIGIDEEGGIVTRLESAGGSSHPGNATLGRLDDVAATRRANRWIGDIVRAAGVDVAAAPDVDVNNNPRNPVIGVRSFGPTPELVSRHTVAAVEGIQGRHVAACAKHFPGHGDTAVDSHLGLPTVDVDLEELSRIHLAPFRAAIEAGVKTIMSAHIIVPALGELPGTLNPNTVSLLRGLGFDGLLVSDALDMAAIAKGVGSARGAVLALIAGVDLLCIGYPELGTTPDGGRADEAQYRRVFDAVVAAVESGELSRGRLEEAVARRRAVAAWCREGAGETGEPLDMTADVAQTFEVRGDVALRGDRVVVVDARGGNRAAGKAIDAVTNALLRRRGVERFPVTDEGTLAAAIEAAKLADDVVVQVNQPQSSEAEAKALAAVLASRPDAVVCQLGVAHEGLTGERVIQTWGMSAPIANAVAELLAGR